MKSSISLSSCWCSGRHRDGYEMIEEMAGLGFDHVELSHGIRITLVPGILRAVEEGMVKISSTHNFCPLPAGITQPAPNLFTPSAPDPREHQQWLRHTRRSLEFASQVKAPNLVTHMGNVRYFWRRPGRNLKNLLRNCDEGENILDSPRYRKALEKSFRQVRKRMPPYWEQLRMSVEEILPDAERCQVTICAENRESFEEMPLDADFPDFFKQALGHKFLGWWHDTGHARIKEQLGILQHRKFLEDNRENLIGFHLHDVDANGRDHLPLGTGTIDFKMIRGFFEPRHVLVLELSPRLTVEQVTDSKKFLEDLIA